MSRRLSAFYRTQPTSRLAVWSRHMALFALVATLLSIIISRFGILESKPALVMLMASLALAGLSILLALAGFAAIWHSGARGFGHIGLALLIDALLLAYPAYLAVQFYRLPPIHDITTDVIDPPAFETLARLRAADGANSAIYPGLYSAEQQRIAYPAIETVEIDASPQRCYDAIMELMTKRRWRVVDARPPQPPRRNGHIEAVARTPLMGFRDDVVIRIAPGDDAGSRIDLRSSSRYFDHDLGANAARLRSLMEDIELIADVVEKPAPKTPQKGKGQGRAPARR